MTITPQGLSDVTSLCHVLTRGTDLRIRMTFEQETLQYVKAQSFLTSMITLNDKTIMKSLILPLEPTILVVYNF